jgi:hypothetical protein
MYFTVRNNGNMTLNLENVSLEGSGNFHLVAPTARSLRPGQQTNLQVTFHAAQTNTIYRTQLVIRSNDLTDRAFRVGLAASYYEPLYLRQLATRQAEQSDASQSLQYSLSAAPIADNVPVRLIAGA